LNISFTSLSFFILVFLTSESEVQMFVPLGKVREYVYLLCLALHPKFNKEHAAIMLRLYPLIRAAFSSNTGRDIDYTDCIFTWYYSVSPGL